MNYLDTSWEHITIKDMFDFIQKNHIAIVDISVDFLLKNKSDLNYDKTRIDNADITKPIIVLMNGKEFMYILDGNHRLMKAIQLEQKTIPAYIIEYGIMPDDWKKIFKLNDE